MCIRYFIFIYIHIHSYKTLKRALVDQALFSPQKENKTKLHIKIQNELAMAYSPSVQYEGYKRPDFALSASPIFFFLFIFLFNFATLKNVFVFCFFVCLFLCFFPLQNSLHTPSGSVVGHRVWASAQQQRGAHRIQEALVGAVLDNDLLPDESGMLRLTAPPSLLPPQCR